MENNVRTVACAMQEDKGNGEVFCESQGTFTLPDYMPEIKRILSVHAVAVPEGKFIGGGKAEFAGQVRYTVCYVTGESGFFSAMLATDYAFSLSTEGEADLRAGVDSMACDVVCRVSGPRKLTLRSNVKSRVRLLHGMCAGDVGFSPEDHMEELREEHPSLEKHVGTSEEWECTASVPLDGYTMGELRVATADAMVWVREVKHGKDGVEVGGEVVFQSLLMPEVGQPFSVSRKTPFRCMVSAEEASSLEGIAYGRCLSCRGTLEAEGEEGCFLSMEAICVVEWEGFCNRSVSFLRDCYSLEYQTELLPASKGLTAFSGCSYGSYAVEGSLPLQAEEGISVIPIDAVGTAKVHSVTQKDRKVLVQGVCECTVLLAEVGEDGTCEYSSVPMELPFRAETDLRLPTKKELVFETHAELPFLRPRQDGTTLYLDGEITLCVVATEESTLSCVDRVILLEQTYPKRKKNRITVMYPADGETVFSVAKRYGVPVQSLMEINPIPTEDGVHDPAYALDGMTHLLIP